MNRSIELVCYPYFGQVLLRAFNLDEDFMCFISLIAICLHCREENNRNVLQVEGMKCFTPDEGIIKVGWKNKNASIKKEV